jgi:6,7-dimethyl-8-ribityllumazine synthase
MARIIEGDLDGKGKRIAVVVSEFNDVVTHQLLESCLEALKECGVEDDDVVVAKVPGAFEIPATALLLAETGEYDALVCLGAVIRGETPHFDYISDHASRGIGDVGIVTGVPTIFGVLTTDTAEQALHRASRDGLNKGAEAGRAAIILANLYAAIGGDS